MICLVLILSCASDNVSAKNNMQIQPVDGKYISFYGEASVLDLQYSNLIITTESGMEIVQPVFRGTRGNIRYEDLVQYCIQKGKLEVAAKRIRPIQVLCKKNDVKKTFNEFLQFYKTNLLKDVDIEHPTRMEQENNTWTICYDFLIDSVPGVLTIDIDGLEETSPKYKSVYEIQVDENGGWFLYHIDIRRKAL
jgi:hypothetical protein